MIHYRCNRVLYANHLDAWVDVCERVVFHVDAGSVWVYASLYLDEQLLWRVGYPFAFLCAVETTYV